jgi:hypothetical protein
MKLRIVNRMSDSMEDEEDSCESPPSSPDIVLEHGSTRLSLDLDGWEWFWLFLAITFTGSLYLLIS